jgi:hypothetical protein
VGSAVPPRVAGAGAGVTTGSLLAIGVGMDPVGPTGGAGTLGTPGSVASMPVEPGPVTVTSMGSPPVPPEMEPPTGSGSGPIGRGPIGRGSSGAGKLGGVVTLSAEAGATGVRRIARPANAVSATSRRRCLIGTTSRV